MKRRKTQLVISSFIERDEESEKVIFTVDGVVEDDGKTVKIKYVEPDDGESKPTKTELSFEKSRRSEITLSRRGGIGSLMVFEIGKRYTWQYDVGFMSMTFCTSTIELSNTVGYDGGEFSVYYSIENFGVELQRVRFTLTVK